MTLIKHWVYLDIALSTYLKKRPTLPDVKFPQVPAVNLDLSIWSVCQYETGHHHDHFVPPIPGPHLPTFAHFSTPTYAHHSIPTPCMHTKPACLQWVQTAKARNNKQMQISRLRQSTSPRIFLSALVTVDNYPGSSFQIVTQTTH